MKPVTQSLIATFRDTTACENSAILAPPKPAHKRGFDWGVAGLKLSHFLFRIRKPKLPRFEGTLLLLFDPVAYEMLPTIRKDTVLTVRQKIARRLALRLGGNQSLAVLEFREISKADFEKTVLNLRFASIKNRPDSKTR